MNAVEPGAIDSLPVAALNLGWFIAELYNYDRIPGEGDERDRRSLVGLGRLARRERARALAMQIKSAAVRLQVSTEWVADAEAIVAAKEVNVKGLRDCIWAGHKSWLVELTVADSRLGRCYGLGRELAETTLLADSGDPKTISTQFDAYRLSDLKASLQDLADCLPALSAGTVASSLDLWLSWAAGVQPASDGAEGRRVVGQALRQQDSRWRAMLAGDTSPRRSLVAAHYLTAGQRFLARISKLAIGVAFGSRLGRVLLALTVLLALAVMVAVYVDRLPAVVASSFLFLGSAVTSAAGLASALRQGAAQIGAPLWEAELQSAMAEANTFIPDRLP
jgi:hypothetical protein